MVKPKSLSDILKENKSLTREVGIEDIESEAAGIDGSGIEEAYKNYLKIKEEG